MIKRVSTYLPETLYRTFKQVTLLSMTLVAMPVVMAHGDKPHPVVLHAARVFDGTVMRTNTSVLVIDGKVAQIDASEVLKVKDADVIDLGDATLLPGFIELHAHLAFQNVSPDVVLKHGITTLRDVGGPIHQPYGGEGSLRVLTSGPIITAPEGYPIPGMGATNIAIAVATEIQARETVRDLVKGGAAVIKIALEPGGEAGAPWTQGHGHGHGHHHENEHNPNHYVEQGHQPLPAVAIHKPEPEPEHKPEQHNKAWPLLSVSMVKAIVDEAHKNGRKVTAHIGEKKGAKIALEAGVDEWAHVPCEVIPDALLKKAVAQQVKIVTTMDTLWKCPGVAKNVSTLTSLGASFLYGAEIAHPDVPWGIDSQELIYMMYIAKMQPLEILYTATAKAGQHLSIPLLGTLQVGAPADMIAIKGDISPTFKNLEYPDFVMSGGHIIVNNFTKH